jgi:hypothetical protein
MTKNYDLTGSPIKPWPTELDGNPVTRTAGTDAVHEATGGPAMAIAAARRVHEAPMCRLGKDCP